MARARTKAVSYWVDSAPAPPHSRLSEDVAVDVAILGAGIVGITAAVLLKRAGLRVAVVEAEHVGGGVTGHTTAKVTSLHGVIYQEIVQGFGERGARRYADANQAALEQVARFVEEDGIDCDFRRRSAYTYAETAEDLGTVRTEADVAKRLGLPARFTEEVPLPWEVAGAVCFDHQAEFHPQRYLLGLAAQVPGDGSHVFEGTRALSTQGNPRRVETTGGTVYATDVIVATHMPILDRGLFFTRTHPERSYAIIVEVGEPAPEGMFLSTESPAHTVRAVPTEDGERLLVGGESHKPGQGGDTSERYRRLERWARERLDVRRITHRWSSQDNMPIDGIPFVGKLTPVSSGLWTATGFRKWGLTNGTAAAGMLAGEILGKPAPWADTFSASRFKPLASATDLTKEGVEDGFHFVADRVRTQRSIEVDELGRGEGRVVRIEGEKVAAYRDDSGRLHTLSPTCTHLGCLVSFNSAERSWDCPCHGSRFQATDGRVLQGPAVRGLEWRAVE